MATTVPAPSEKIYVLKKTNIITNTEVSGTYGQLTITNQSQLNNLGLNAYTSTNSSSMATYVIYGTPTKSGSATIYFKFKTASNSSTYWTTQATIYVENCKPVITATSPLRNAKRKHAFQQEVSAYGSADMVWSVIDGELPPGMSINPDNGWLQGYPDVLSVKINAENFPDEGFREYIKTEIMGDANATELSAEKRNLTVNIDISGRNITDLKGIEYFRWLSTLNCSNTPLTKVDLRNSPYCTTLVCDNMADLTELYIDNSYFSGALSNFGSLTGLKILNLYNCSGLTGALSGLKNLTELEELNLYNCTKITGVLSDLSGLTKLKMLNLYECSSLTGVLSDLSDMRNLDTLDLYGCRNLTGALSDLRELTELKTLNLYNCVNLTGNFSDLNKNTGLRALNLYGCYNITGALSDLNGLTGIIELVLYSNRPTGALSDLHGMTELQTLTLGLGYNITGALSDLSDMKNLENLNLNYCRKLTGTVGDLSGLTGLKTLNLSNCAGLTGDLNGLTNMSGLTSLTLDSCNFTAQLSNISGLTELTILGLSNNKQITGTLSDLSEMSNLNALDLRDCPNITGEASIMNTYAPKLTNFTYTSSGITGTWTRVK